MVIKKDTENTDLDKCLYISLEKIGSLDLFNNTSPNSSEKKTAFIILGSSGGRIDHTFSTYHHVFKYLNLYSEQLSETEIYMISKSSMSVFLKPGTNNVESCELIQNKNYGYSIIPIYGESTANITDSDNSDNKGIISYVYPLEIFLKFGESVHFYKKTLPNKIRITVDSEKAALLYTCTTLFYNKFK
jgi:thiamine pyrophosphokinase